MGAKKLTPEDRDEIARLHSRGCGVREIARQVRRSPSTVSHELEAGSWHDSNVHAVTYVAIHAQSLRNKRAKRSGKQPKLTLPKYAGLRAYVEQHIRDGWSPEQIAGRLPIDYPHTPAMRLGHEAIYRYLYAPEQVELKLWEYLPRKQKKRRRRPGRRVHKSHIPDRVSIHKRPKAVAKRKQFGHYEGDSVEGKQSVGDGIHTEVERVSGKLFARKVARITSADTVAAQLAIFKALPARARRTTTLDNGRENHQHAVLKAQLHIQAYFADPYSSWQRGCNENANGLLRRYLPKRTDFTALSQADLNDIVEEINNRPRKRLDYKTPNEVFSSEIKKLRGVRIRMRM
ncbi:IS30 family transposase [Candidatus Saccharibacteria bacterium]|nr:MAG: IS30 family transposase [Candidatus Saccharibacteria bacterium]